MKAELSARLSLINLKLNYAQKHIAENAMKIEYNLDKLREMTSDKEMNKHIDNIEYTIRWLNTFIQNL